MFKLNLSATEAKVIFLSCLGGALEFYDFVMYMFFGTVLNQLFFPSQNNLISLMGIFAVFAIGYLIRPLGGILFGHFGDKYGRKKTFVITVMLMALPTFLMGLLPTWSQVGVLATVLLVILRILQGLAVGGEIPGAIVFAGEHVTANHRGLTCAIIFFGLNMGMILGSLLSIVLFSYLSSTQLINWGWRLPFLFGGVLGIVSYFLRKYMTETPIFAQLHKRPDKVPLYEAIRFYWPQLLQGMLLTWLGAVVVCLLFLYMPTYLTAILHYPKASIAIFNTLNLFIFSCLIIVMGWASDQIGRKPVLQIGAIGFIVLGYFLFFILAINIFYVLGAMLLFSLLGACITGVYPSTLLELFPTQIRYTGFAIAYNLGFAIFGGLSPLLATYLIQATSKITAPSYYLIFSAGACLTAIFTLPAALHKKILS